MNEDDVEALLKSTTLVPAPVTFRARAPARSGHGRLMTAAALLVCAAAVAALFLTPPVDVPLKAGQEETKRLDAILKRLADESLDRRDAATAELRAFLDGDARADLLRARLAELGTDARARAEEALARYASGRHGRIAYMSGRELRVVDWDGRNGAVLAADQNPPLGAAWSRDGSRGAYTTGNRIVIIDAKGTRVKQIVCGSREPKDLSWSPDGTRVTYWTWSTGDPGCRKVWVTDLEGVQKRLTEGDACESCPSWSPDGGWIAFWDNDGSLFLIQPDGSGRRALTKQQTSGIEPTVLWTRDGKALLAAGADCARIVDLDGNEKSRLEGWGWNWQWSPDGRRLAFERENNVWVADADLKNAKALTKESRENRVPAWSLDGSRIAFLSGRDDARERGQKGFSARLELYTMDAEGRGQTRLTTEGVQSRPCWIR